MVPDCQCTLWHSWVESTCAEWYSRLRKVRTCVAIHTSPPPGIPIRDTFDDHDRLLTIQYAALITQMVAKSRAAVKELDATNDLSFLRIRSRKHEILVAPDRDYILIVIQDPRCD